jgi:hypothetical protein
MTTARRLLVTLGFAGSVLALVACPCLARADSADLKWIKGGATPPVIQGLPSQQRLSCPLLVKPAEAALQPLSIAPGEVEAKNRLGCLSSNDAFYGPDGCPQKLCGAGRGVIPLPPGSASQPTPQLPAP